jgi:hypothetical protein
MTGMLPGRLCGRSHELTTSASSLGSSPYNGGAFYGNADTTFQSTAIDGTEAWTLANVQIPVTSQT